MYDSEKWLVFAVLSIFSIVFALFLLTQAFGFLQSGFHPFSFGLPFEVFIIVIGLGFLYLEI